MSLSLVRPGFAIPKILQMQGVVLDGADDMFWARETTADGHERTTEEDVNALLDSVEPAIMMFNLAGYEVDHVLMSLHGYAPSTILDINLPNFSYEQIEGSPDSHGNSYWYTRTGMEWQTDPNTSPSADIPFVPYDLLGALSFVLRERDWLKTGEVTYAVDLRSVGALDVPASEGVPQRAVTVYISGMPDNEYDLIGQSAMQALAAAFQPLVQEMMAYAQIDLSDRWLAVDGDPTGLLHVFNPDDDIVAQTSGKPTRWGCSMKLSAADQKIVETCREIWQYLQTLDYNDYYLCITAMSSADLLKQARGVLGSQNKLSLPFVPSRGKTLQFAYEIRLKVSENGYYELPKDWMLKYLQPELGGTADAAPQPVRDRPAQRRDR